MKKTITLLAFIFCIGAKSQIATTAAGNGTQGYSGDGGPATAATLYAPEGVAIDASGNLYIADAENSCIRKVDTNGNITTAVGNGSFGYSGDGGLATAAVINYPFEVVFDYFGNMYIADNHNNAVRKVNTAGIISTFISSGMGYVLGMACDHVGNLYLSDANAHVIRKANTAGVITTIAGDGTRGYSGDGGHATNAELNSPEGVAVDALGNVYISDTWNSRIRMVNTNGIISTVVGTGAGASTFTCCYGGDGGPATAADINMPYGIAIDATGNLYIDDHNNNYIRKVNTAGIISTVGGDGTSYYNGDGGPATAAGISSPDGIAVDNLGNLYVSASPNVVRKISNCLNPINLNIIGPDTICLGDSTTLKVNINGASSYTWSANAGGTVSDSVIVNPTSTTSYSLTSINGGCIAFQTFTVTVDLIMPSAYSNAPCESQQPLNLNCSPSGLVSYSWSGPNSFTSTIQNPTIPSTSVTAATSGVYTVSVTDAYGCANNTTVAVFVNPLPVVSINNPTVCVGQPINLYAFGGTIVDYAWSGPLGYTSATSNPFIPNATTNMAGAYYVTVTDWNGCANANVATVIVNPLPTDSFILFQDILPHTWDAYAFYSSNVDSARWYWGDSTSTAGLYPSHTYSVAGWYNICVTVTDTAGCTATYCQNDSLYRLANNNPLSSMVYINIKQGVAGISQISGLNNANISIYPNPNNGSFVVEPSNATKKTMQVYDVNGKLVLSQTINGKTNIDASTLNEGVYTISLINNEGVVNKKLIIVH